jgi:hypothetical protein
MSDREHDFYPPPDAVEFRRLRSVIFPGMLLPAFGSGLVLPLVTRQLSTSPSWDIAFPICAGLLMFALAVLMGVIIRFRLAQSAAWAPPPKSTETQP